MRRCGKTWTCFQRMQELVREGVPKARLLHVNVEDDRLLPFAAGDFLALLDAYFARQPDLKGDRCYLFLDEVQRVEGWDAFVRRVLDTENTKGHLYEYPGHLCDAYLPFLVPVRSRSEAVRRVNPAKVYVVDTGLLDAESLAMAGDRGAVLESVVFLHLRPAEGSGASRCGAGCCARRPPKRARPAGVPS